MVQNLYADKVFARHPSALWSFDDSISAVVPTTLPSTIALTGSTTLYAYAAESYGGTGFDAYYIGSDNTAANLGATNAGIPIVYGANDVTTIVPVPSNTGVPSIIVPGFGFLNENGRFRTITVEMWLRINSTSHYPRKIFGPIASEDGLYVSGPFLSLKIGRNIASHSVGEWGRPLLIHLGISNNSAFLMINGEQVITISLNEAEMLLPAKYDINSDDQDWLGFYAYNNVTPINLDCVSIYPYRVSLDEAKIRFAWGKSTESPENGGTKDLEVPVVIDYKTSQYANNYSYPEKSDWQSGFLDNAESKNKNLTVPEYSLPRLAFAQEKSLEDWYVFQESINTETSSLSSGETLDNDIFFKLNDNNWGIDTYMSFPNLNIIKETIDAIYVVGEYSSLPTSTQTIFKIKNGIGEYFSCVYNNTGSTIQYKFVSNGSTQVTFDGPNITANEIFGVGINIPLLLDNASATNQMRAFFSNRSSLALTIGGDSDFADLCTAKFFKIGFSNAKNYDSIKNAFISGLVVGESYESQPGDEADILLENFANYTLFGLYTYGTFALDIATYSYWEDFVPLTLLAKNVLNTDGSQIYDLDFIQFNVDYPASENIVSSNVSTINEIVKTYIYFSDMTSPETTTAQLSRSLVNLPETTIVEPDSTWSTKIYEVVDGTIIYAPAVSDFTQLSINLQFELKIPGILRNNIKIRNTQLASQVLNKNTKTLIGSKLNRNMNPYRIVSGIATYDDYKNPFRIYKNHMPYLYLTKNSGIQLLGSTFDGTRGIEIPINSTSKSFFLLDILQFAVYYDKVFPSSPTEVLRLNVGTQDKYAVMIDGIGDNTKAVVYVKDLTNGRVVYDLELYVNGQSDSAPSASEGGPYVDYKNWNFITIKFNPVLNFEKTVGYIRITGPFLLNNIVNYQVSEEEYGNKFTPTLWSEVKDRNGDSVSETWSQTIASPYEEANATWYMLYESDEIRDLGQSAQEIYKAYFGSNRITAIESNIPVEFFKYQYVGYLDVDGTASEDGSANQKKVIPRFEIKNNNSNKK